jgi:hypothetical protein
MGPATLVVLLLVGMLVVAGVLIANAGAKKRRVRRRCPVADCGHLNDPGARFCAHCGKELPQD